jgi:type II restriction enzyme
MAPREALRALPEPSVLEAQAVTVVDAPMVDETLASGADPRTHTEIQAKLRDIGFAEGYDVWVADRGIEWNGNILGDGCLTDLPVVAPDRTRVALRGIDVIWFRKGTGHPARFFEIEHSTSVYSGLLRMNDVKIDFPLERAFIVGEGERTQAKFAREISRRTFQASGLATVTKFLLYSQIRQTWTKYQAIGAGSKDWDVSGRDGQSRVS